MTIPSDSTIPSIVEHTTGRLLVGSCLDRLRELPAASVDSIVTDPPYELGFMGKKWDASGIAYNVDLWVECLRVLKPGGHLLAFGGTRTYHRMVVAIEDAGFEIRDSIHYTYGSGFPKSHNVGKALEALASVGSSSPTAQRKAAMGDGYEPTPLAGTPGYGTTGNFQNKDTGGAELAVSDPVAQQWAGWGTALKPSHEPVVVARKPLAGTVAACVLEHGTGGLNIDGCRVSGALDGDPNRFAKTDGGSFASFSDAPVVRSEGRWPANTILGHSPECAQVGTATVKAAGWADTDAGTDTAGASFSTSRTSRTGTHYGNADGLEEVSVWECVPGCPVAELDGQQDGASRFFNQCEWGVADEWPTTLYIAKPSRAERNAGTDHLPAKDWKANKPVDSTTQTDRSDGRPNGNNHPTVKPVALIRHLQRLVTQPGGTTLDPFMGSGTSAVAAVLEGFRWVGCELTADYLPIIAGRVAWAEGEVAAGRAAKPRFKAPAVKPAVEPAQADGDGQQQLFDECA